MHMEGKIVNTLLSGSLDMIGHSLTNSESGHQFEFKVLKALYNSDKLTINNGIFKKTFYLMPTLSFFPAFKSLVSKSLNSIFTDIDKIDIGKSLYCLPA